MSQAQHWWMIQASAALQAVATQNYACFGRAGVPRYSGRPERAPQSTPPPRDSASLCVELIIRAPDESTRYANLDVTLTPQEKNAQHIIWSGYDPAQHLQTIWVWDFFRLMSHVVLRVADIPPDTDPDPAWKAALDGLRSVCLGDTLALDVRSACGDIHQSHTLTGPAILWEPA